MSRLVVGLVFAGLAGCAHRGAGGLSDWKAEILEAERRRDAGAEVLAKSLASSQPQRRRAALWALGRIEEVGTSSSVAPLLMDADPGVAAGAAFALGQIGDDGAREALRDGLLRTLARPEALRALARCGNAGTAEDLARWLDDSSVPTRAAAALSLGLLKKRLSEVDERYADKLAGMVTDAAPEVRFATAYALARFEGPTSVVALVPLLVDPDPEVRLWATIGLGRSGATPNALDASLRDSDWRVRAAGAAALGRIAETSPTEAGRAVARLDTLASRAFDAIVRGDRLQGGQAMHVLSAALAGAEQAGGRGRRVLESIEHATWETENLSDAVSRDLARVQCGAAAALDRLDGRARRINTCGKGTFSEVRRRQLWMSLRARSGAPDAVEEIAAFARNPDPRLRTSAVLALGEIESAESTRALVALLDSNDPAVSGGALEVLARPERAGLRPPAIAERLFDVLERLLAQPDDSLVVGPIDAVVHLGRTALPFLGRTRAWLEDPRPAVRRRTAILQDKLTGQKASFGASPRVSRVVRPSPWPRALEVAFETDRGRIVLAFDGGRAPRFTGMVKALVERGFYQGKRFHRVVSTFVTQGGCPRGDGWGGPGYTVASETSSVPFRRGAIGIATNGRDTGGSQLFFMHAYHPHLDGRYSWVGRVREGLDVVEALQVDDRILRAYFP